MKRIRKAGKIICDIIYLISLTLLGKIELGSFTLSTYQIVVSVFWISGILKFMNRENEWKEELEDVVKDFFVAIAIILILYRISGTYEVEIYEPSSILVHFVVLLVIVWITWKAVGLSGKWAYLTHAAIPLIAILLIRAGVPSIPAVIVAVVLPEPINYLLFLRKQKAVQK